MDWLQAGFTNAMERNSKDECDGTLYGLRGQVVGIQIVLESNLAFQMHTDTTNWIGTCSHAPRARLFVDKTGLLASLMDGIQIYLIDAVEDECENQTLDVLQTKTYSNPETLHKVYVRIRIPIDHPNDCAEIPIVVCTQKAGFCNEVPTWRGTIQLHIMNGTLQEPSKWIFHLDLWQHHTSIARWYQVGLWSNDHFRLIKAYLRTLVELGQKSLTIVATEVPWAGQQCYLETDYPSALYEHSIFHVYYDFKNGIQVDFTAFDRLIKVAESIHMNIKEFDVFGLMSIWVDHAHHFVGPSITNTPDHWRVRCYNRDTSCFFYLSTIEHIECFIVRLYKYFDQCNILAKIRICADEPHDVAIFNTQVKFLSRLGPQFKFKVAINKFEFMHHAPPNVIDIVPILPLVCNDVGKTQHIHANILKNQGTMLWYLCCQPKFPNNFVSSPLIEGRLLGWITYLFQLDGFLRWNYCLWPSHPWTNLKWQTKTWPVGDMYFVLPGHSGSPIETLRFEALRFGIQDYEILQMAQRKLSTSKANQVITSALNIIFKSADKSEFSTRYINNEKSYTLNPKDYDTAINLIIHALF